MNNPRAQRLVVGIDTGGTFTDIVATLGKQSFRFKLLSTPHDPAVAVIEGLRRLFPDHSPDTLTYGTTVATNAMLQRHGARTALVTTEGFEDVIEIGRQARSSLYSLEPCNPPALVPRRLRIGLPERMLVDGTVEVAPDVAALARLRKRVEQARVRSIAVCLLHAGSNPAHEKAAREALKPLGLPVTVSHTLSPEPGEYERTSTTVANAYVRPLMEEHIGKLRRESGARQFRVMQSNSGCIGAAVSAREPIRTMLSGPAGGVAAALACLRRAEIRRAITFDMGGTSTDVALLGADLPRRASTRVGSIPIRTPCLDIHTVGAGGGSIAYVDAGGSLKVGPQSAGADPGPACYGNGASPTVTDANLVLGRLRRGFFLGGGMTLDMACAESALNGLACKAKTGDAWTTAAGIIEVVEANMEQAVRLITVERGEDPRDCTLVCFGGAAALHGCGLAEKLGLREILVPADPGLLSARGMMDGVLVRDLRVPVRAQDPSLGRLQRITNSSRHAAERALRAEGIKTADIRTEVFVSLRYLGQSIEIEVPLARGFRAAFDRAHLRLLHSSDPGRSVECCGARVTATERRSTLRPRTAATSAVADLARPKLRTGGARGLPPTRRAPRHCKPEPVEQAQVHVGGRKRRVPVFKREGLLPGYERSEPAVIVEYSSTILLDEGWNLWVDADTNLRLERSARG